MKKRKKSAKKRVSEEDELREHTAFSAAGILEDRDRNRNRAEREE